jgi:Fibronectin type III domain
MLKVGFRIMIPIVVVIMLKQATRDVKKLRDQHLGCLFCLLDEPSAPRNLRIKDYWTDYITVLWDGPQSDGGSPLTGYIIEKRDVSRPTWVKAGTVDADCTEFKATNLFEGVEYTFRVYAVNIVGPSREPAVLDRPCKAKMPFGELSIM